MQDKMAVLGNCEDMTSFSYAGFDSYFTKSLYGGNGVSS